MKFNSFLSYILCIFLIYFLHNIYVYWHTIDNNIDRFLLVTWNGNFLLFYIVLNKGVYRK